MKTTLKRRGRGFTLVELSVAITVGVAIAAIGLSLFNQQIAFLRIFGAQGFLTDEAPLVNMHVSRLVGKAERFRLHATLAEALTGSNPQTGASPVLVLNFRMPDGQMRAAILAFQDLGTGNALYYYLVPTSGALGAPQWYVTKQPQDVAFSVESGILRMMLTGPHGEQITYSGAMGQ